MSSSSYDKVKHIVEIDENILAVFIVDSAGKISDLFIADDANIDNSYVQSIQSNLKLRFVKEEEIEENTDSLGKHIWDIAEYEKIRVIKIYESNRLIVVLAKSHMDPGDVSESVLGYLHESDDDNSSQPPSLF
jgi:hypothetical protein